MGAGGRGELTVATGVVVGRVLLARDELLRVIELAVRARANLVCWGRGGGGACELKPHCRALAGEGEERGGGRADDGRLEVDEDRAGHVLAGAGLGEEGVECVVAAADRLVGRHLAIGLDAVLEAVQLPARVAGLHAALTKMDGDDLTHD